MTATTPHEIEVEEQCASAHGTLISPDSTANSLKDDGTLIRSKVYRFHALLARSV